MIKDRFFGNHILDNIITLTLSHPNQFSFDERKIFYSIIVEAMLKSPLGFYIPANSKGLDRAYDMALEEMMVTHG